MGNQDDDANWRHGAGWPRRLAHLGALSRQGPMNLVRRVPLSMFGMPFGPRKRSAEIDTGLGGRRERRFVDQARFVWRMYAGPVVSLAGLATASLIVPQTTLKAPSVVLATPR